jgi:hypothetical protein
LAGAAAAFFAGALAAFTAFFGAALAAFVAFTGFVALAAFTGLAAFVGFAAFFGAATFFAAAAFFAPGFGPGFLRTGAAAAETFAVRPDAFFAAPVVRPAPARRVVARIAIAASRGVAVVSSLLMV